MELIQSVSNVFYSGVSLACKYGPKMPRVAAGVALLSFNIFIMIKANPYFTGDLSKLMAMVSRGAVFVISLATIFAVITKPINVLNRLALSLLGASIGILGVSILQIAPSYPILAKALNGTFVVLNAANLMYIGGSWFVNLY